MTILDENIVANQAQVLRGWRIRFHQIGVDDERSGILDEAIIPLLHSLNHPTFFTRDGGFYDSRLRHQRSCLVWLAVERSEVAVFIPRFLRHSRFDTQNKRMCVWFAFQVRDFSFGVFGLMRKHLSLGMSGKDGRCLASKGERILTRAQELGFSVKE